MASVADVRALGYTVVEAKGGYVIRGYGVSSFFTDADLAAFADPAVHAARVDQFKNGPPTTPKAEPIEQKVVAELQKLDPGKATVADLLAAVQAVLA